MGSLRGEDEHIFNTLKEKKRNVIMVGNKIDLLNDTQKEQTLEDIKYNINKENFIAVSASKGINIDVLHKKIFRNL